MEHRKGMMKVFLSENLRDLMQKNMFEKITIKQICDATGVIRATFYNYFIDKYDCLNYLVYQDIVQECLDYKIVTAKEVDAILESMLTNVEENREFYKIAYNVTGQNSFEDMVRENLALVFKHFLGKFRKPNYMEKYDDDYLSKYYAECVAFHIKEFVFRKDNQRTIAEEKVMIIDLMKLSLSDFLDISEQRYGL